MRRQNKDTDTATYSVGGFSAILPEVQIYLCDPFQGRENNGTDTHTLKLDAGDVLDVRFETEYGKLHMEIKLSDGTLIYTGNGEEATDFTVNISDSGEYSVRVEAKDARGKISIQRIALQEEKK